MGEDFRKEAVAKYYRGESTLKPEHRWKGPGDPPRKWTAEDGTVVYRSYEDYCDD